MKVSNAFVMQTSKFLFWGSSAEYCIFMFVDFLVVLNDTLFIQYLYDHEEKNNVTSCYFFFKFFLSLPSLRPLLDVYYLPLTNMRIARTFCFTNNGQALYLVSPTEIQRLTYSQETCENLQVTNKTKFAVFECSCPPGSSVLSLQCLSWLNLS